MKRKTEVLSLALLLVSGILYAQNKVTISGKVRFIDDNNNKVVVIKNRGFEKIVLGEAVIASDKTYSLSVVNEQPEAVYVNCCNSQSVRVWLEDEDMSINFRGVDTAKVKLLTLPLSI